MSLLYLRIAQNQIMNMYSGRYDSLISKLPREREAIERFIDLIEAKVAAKARSSILDANRLYDLIKPTSYDSLIEILNIFEREGIIEKRIRLESPQTKVGIKDFKSILDIPSTVHDQSQDLDIEVRPENLRLIYIVNIKVDGD